MQELTSAHIPTAIGLGIRFLESRLAAESPFEENTVSNPGHPTKTIIALSSAEAELYALLKGAAQTLGLISMASDFGDKLQGSLWSDASAAIAISQRSGLGKLRHIQTQFLWLQERVSAKELQLTKVVGTANPADMLTKYLAKADLDKHLQFSGLLTRVGRADGSLQVGSLSRAESNYVRGVIRTSLTKPKIHFMTMDSSKVGECPLQPRGGTYLKL